LRHIEFLGEFTDGPFIRPSLGQCPRPARAGFDDASRGQQAPHHRRVEGLAPLGWAPGFLVEDRRDGGAAVTRPVQVSRAGNQGGVGTERLQPSDRAHQLMGRLVPAMPVAFQPDLFTAVDHGDQNPLDQQAHDDLTVFAGGRRRLPQCRQVSRQLPDRGQFGRSGRLRTFAPEAFVISRELHLL